MLLQDLRYALRSLWHSKGFATVAILCLGLGIGLNTTIFSIVDGVLLQAYPYTDPDRILAIGEQNPGTHSRAGLSYLDMRDWNEANSAFVTIAASEGRSLTVADAGEEPERDLGAAISWDLFPMLGTSPVLGRGFTLADDQPSAPGTVLLGYALWTRRYRQDPNIVGRTILVNGKPHDVIGVMPEHFEFPENQRLWVPLAPMAAAKEPRDARNLRSFGRMKPGVTRERATQELNAIAARLEEQYRATNDGWTAHVRTLREAFLPEEVTLVLYLMMAGVTLVLFIACSNVANLLLARASARRREFAVRAAIGAGRGRIVRQLLTESLVLGLSCVPLGIACAEVGTRLIASAMPVDQVPYYVQWRVDWRSLAYTVGVAASTALIFGLFPALQASRRDLHENLKDGSRGTTAGRSLLRSSLVVAQVSLALVALVGALLFVRTFLNLDSFELGFNTRPLMTLRFYMTGDAYEPRGSKSRRVEDIVRRIEGLPAVEAAFASNLIPISGGGGGGQVEIDGVKVDPQKRTGSTFTGVTPHFFGTLGVPLVRGRDFTDSEGWSQKPVAIVNQRMAKYWPRGDAIDHRFRVVNPDGATVWFTVIGIAPDVKLFGVDPGENEAPQSAFVPYGYQESLNTGLTIRVNGGDPASATAAARAAIRASDPNIPLYAVRTLEEVRRVSFWQYGLYGWIFGTIGLVGLLLAAVGVYGVLSYSVSQRTQEIGVRMAMGAEWGQVVKLFVGQGLLLTGIGIAIGMVLAAYGMPLAKSLLYKVSPLDPLSFGAVGAFLVLTALLASFVPALRATRIDPVIALRAE
jgi:putative ABC transport system permease protein